MAPRPDLLTPLGRVMIDELPVVLREDPDYQAVMHCVARSTAQKDAYIAWVRDQANPLTADARGLGWWESLLRVPAPDVNDSLELRRKRVVDRFRSLEGDPSTVDWVRRINAVVGDQPWRWEQYLPPERRAQGQDTPVPPWTIRIFLSMPSTDPSWTVQTAKIRDETPSEMDLIFASLAGFLLDASRLDTDAMTI